jgi:ketosteroid isomerase-like protein
MQSWLARKLVGLMMGRLRRGDLRVAMLLDAPDVEMTFPGQSSWGGVVKGRAEHRRWLERFAAVGLQIFPDEVVLTGFPWRQTLCIRGTDHALGPGGERVYENRYVIWGHLRWGRLADYEVYEDTVRTLAFDEWLAGRELAAAPPARVGV